MIYKKRSIAQVIQDIDNIFHTSNGHIDFQGLTDIEIVREILDVIEERTPKKTQLRIVKDE